MTTIAADLEQMVSDSKVSLAQKNLSYPALKIVKVGDAIYGAAGDGGDCTRFLRWASNGFKGTEPKWGTAPGSEDAVIGLILRPAGIFCWVWGDPEPERIEAPFYAIGSGGKAARVAMLMGASIVEAVNLAIEVDPGSGPPLQILKLKD